MTGVRLELGNPNAYKTVQEYVERHVAPVVTELHRLTTEILAPGATSAEECGVDMVSDPESRGFRRLDRHLSGSPTAKHVVFDGAESFKIAADVLRNKRLKVQLSAVVYQRHLNDGGIAPVVFRLAGEDGIVISDSEFHCISTEPTLHSRVLPFGRQMGCIEPSLQRYYLEASGVPGVALPVCRRFSLSFIYI